MYRFSIEDIMKGLEICSVNGPCKKCPFDVLGDVDECTTYLAKGALELILFREGKQWAKSTNTPDVSTAITTNAIDAYLAETSSCAELGLQIKRK